MKLWKINSHCYYVLAYLHNRNFLKLFLVRSLASFVNFLFSRSRSSWTITQSSLAPLTFTRFSVTSLYDGIFSPRLTRIEYFHRSKFRFYYAPLEKITKWRGTQSLFHITYLALYRTGESCIGHVKRGQNHDFSKNDRTRYSRSEFIFWGALKTCPPISLFLWRTHVFYRVEFHWISYQRSTKIISENNFLIGNLIKNQIFKKWRMKLSNLRLEIF